MRYLSKIYPYLFSALFVLIPWTEHLKAIPNILLAMLLVLFPFVVKRHCWTNLKINSFYLFLGLILLVAIEILAKGRFEDFSFLSRIMIVLIISVLAIPLGKYDFKKPIIAFLIGSGLLILASSSKLISHYIINQSLKLDVGKNVNDLLMGERPFLGFIYLISVILCLFLSRIERKKIIKRLLIISSFVFGIFILLISARLSLLSLVIVLVSALFFYTKNLKKTFLFLFGAISAIIILALFNPNFSKRFTAGFEQEEFSVKKIIVLEPRSHIWSCSFEIANKNSVPLLGYGFRGSIDKLVNCYTTRNNFINEEHRSYFLTSRFNTHNQFINFYLSAGWIAFFIFIAFFVVLFKNNYSNYTTFTLVLALFLFCCFENVLSRQLGAMLFGIVYSFLIILNKVSTTDSNYDK